METSILTTPAYHHETEYAQPIAQTNRIQTLDILRGIALLGILLMNIWGFGMTNTRHTDILRGPHSLSYWLDWLLYVLFAHKMRALFSMLFGAGIVLFLSKPRDQQRLGTPDLLIRRQLGLMAFGLVNSYVLLWRYDILFHYGLTGILLFPFHRLRAQGLLILATVVMVLNGGKSYWLFAEQKAKYASYQPVVALEKKKAKLTDKQQDDKTTWETLLRSRQYDPEADAAETRTMRSDYATVWANRLPLMQQSHAVYYYQIGFFDIAAMVLLGMALFKWGFFTSQLTIQQYRWLAVGGLVGGLALKALAIPAYTASVLDFASYIRTYSLPVVGLLLPFERAIMAVGWAALVVLLYRSGVWGWLWTTLRAVGQLAFTNYLMQSVFCTLFFNGYGFGYFGSLKFYQLYIVVAAIWLIQIVFSVVWLRYFQFGPLEWVWRSLTYGKRQPMLRLTPSTQKAAVSA